MRDNQNLADIPISLPLPSLVLASSASTLPLIVAVPSPSSSAAETNKGREIKADEGHAVRMQSYSNGGLPDLTGGGLPSVLVNQPGPWKLGGPIADRALRWMEISRAISMHERP